MRLSLDHREGNIITGYVTNGVIINQTTVEHSVILTPQEITAWAPGGFDDLRAEHFQELLNYSPELILLGTGLRLRFPTGSLTQSLIEANIGIEIMDTVAACRTYNILMAEGRAVLAALLPPAGTDGD